MSIFEHFYTDKDPNIEDATFKKGKADAFDFVNRRNRGRDTLEGKIDRGIGPLIRRLNELPFLYTHTGSCEGHASGRDEVIRAHPDALLKNLRLPPVGMAKYYVGYFNIKIDWSPESLKFLKDLKGVVAHFPNAFIQEGHDSESEFQIIFDDERKNGKTFPLEDAKAFETEGRKLMEEVKNLVDSYLENKNSIGL